MIPCIDDDPKGDEQPCLANCSLRYTMAMMEGSGYDRKRLGELIGGTCLRRVQRDKQNGHHKDALQKS